MTNLCRDFEGLHFFICSFVFVFFSLLSAEGGLLVPPIY